ASLATAELVTALLFAPWCVILWSTARAGTAGVGWTREFSPASVGYYVYAAHFGASFGPNLRALHALPTRTMAAAHWRALVVAAGAIAVSAVAYVLLLRDALRRRERRWELLPLVAWPLLSLPAPFAYAAVRDFPLHPRHLLYAWPLVPIVL